MNQKNYEDFLKLLWLFANDAGIKISKEQAAVKFETLKKYPLEQISKAADKLLHYRKRNWPAIPSTSEFVEAIEEDTQEIESKTKAQLQVDIILKYLNHYGSACYHTFKDPITNYLMTNRWSFQKLGLMKAEDLKWFRKDFCEAYQDMRIDTMFSNITEAVVYDTAIPVENLKKLLDRET